MRKEGYGATPSKSGCIGSQRANWHNVAFAIETKVLLLAKVFAAVNISGFLRGAGARPCRCS